MAGRGRADRIDRDEEPGRGRERVGWHAQPPELQRQDGRERAADEVHEEQHDQERQHAREAAGSRRTAPAARRRTRPPRRLRVVAQHERERDRAERRRQHERRADADRVGQQAARQRPDGRRQDLRGLDLARPPGPSARAAATRWPWPARAGRCRRRGRSPMRSASSCQTSCDRGEQQQEHVGDQRAHGHRLLPVAVGQPAPDGRQQAGEQRRHPDEDARPERAALLVLDAQLAHVERQERQHEREAGEDHEHARDHRPEVARATARAGRARPGRRRSRRAARPRRGPARRGSRAGARGRRPTSRARGPGRPPRGGRRRRGGSPRTTSTSRQRTPRLQPVPIALLAASLPAMASARARLRAGSSGGSRAASSGP